MYRKDLKMVAEAFRHWSGMMEFRRNRARCKRYCYGDQWGDPVMVDGHRMREEHYIRSQGSEPLKNNLIRRLVKQVLGLYRSESGTWRADCGSKKATQTMNALLQRAGDTNCMDELGARALEEFLISGFVVQRKTFGWRQGRCGSWTDNVSPDSFIIDARMADCRGWDAELVGEIHDLRFDAVCQEFARDAADVKLLADIYDIGDYDSRLHRAYADFGIPFHRMDDFLQPSAADLCRVYELWYRRRTPGYLYHDRVAGRLSWLPAASPAVLATPMEGERVWTIAEEWRYCYLSPFGDVLAEGVTPYAHGSHPYVFKAYPFIDGEIHSFVADVIDQQRYTNRLITLYDWVMRSSAKGVLLVPEECIPEGYSIEDVAADWARFNGVIPVKTRNGAQLPQQVSANAVNIGIHELLQTQLYFMEDISGVTGALQGKTDSARTSGTLYEQQTHNATLSQLDLLDSFRHFIKDGLDKEVSNIQQMVPLETIREFLEEGEIETFRTADFSLQQVGVK